MFARPVKAAATAALAAMLVLPAAASPALAAPPSTLNAAVSSALGEDLRAAAPSDGSVSIGAVSVSVSPELVKAAGSSDPDVIADYIMSEAKRVADSEKASLPMSASALAAPPGPSVPIANYTARKETPLPSFGVAWVGQDMSLVVTGNTINSIKLKGNSYGWGVSLFAYNHVNTSLVYNKNKSCVNTMIKGTFSAVVKKANVAFPATVKASDAARGGRMVAVNYADC